MNELEVGVGFAITVPPSWFEIDLLPATREASIAALVEERLREVPELWDHRATIVRLLRTQAREAWAAGARYCACMVEPTEEGPITASVTVSVVTGPLGVRRRDAAYADALLAPLRPKTAKDDDDTWCEVRTVDVPDSDLAARSWGVEDVDLPDGAGWVRVVQMTHLAAVPGVNRVVMVNCSSPVVALAEPMLDMFDAICGTVRLVRAVPVGVDP
jgi:hypothetical protein